VTRGGGAGFASARAWGTRPQASSRISGGKVDGLETRGKETGKGCTATRSSTFRRINRSNRKGGESFQVNGQPAGKKGHEGATLGILSGAGPDRNMREKTLAGISENAVGDQGQ